MSAKSKSAVQSQQADEAVRTIGRLIKLVFTSVMRGIDQRMQPLELTAMQWEPMLLLHMRRVDTVAALARVSHVNCGAMTRMLDRLEGKGLLRRRRSDVDRRVVHLELTPKGSEIASQIMPIVTEELNRQLSGFSAEERATLIRLLERMLANGSPEAPLAE